jgi:hypothetical protein
MNRATEGQEGVSPKFTLNFGVILSDQEIARVEQEIIDRGFGGWTWYDTTRGSSVMIACVPQWGCVSAAHRHGMTDLVADADLAEYKLEAKEGWLRTEVVERQDYDRILGQEVTQ